MSGDNKFNFILTRDFKIQNCIEHIDIIHHYIYQLVEDKKLVIKKILILDILINSFTKAFFI